VRSYISLPVVHSRELPPGLRKYDVRFYVSGLVCLTSTPLAKPTTTPQSSFGLVFRPEGQGLPQSARPIRAIRDSKANSASLSMFQTIRSSSA